METNFYIFTVNDVPFDSKNCISANIIVDTLLENKCWLFREGTPNLKYLNADDKVLLYLCGKDRRYFHAEIIIGGTPLNIDDTQIKFLASKLCLSWMSMYCYLNTVRVFTKPIEIKPLIKNLNFIVDKKNYGLNLRLPIVRINASDYTFIINNAL